MPFRPAPVLRERGVFPLNRFEVDARKRSGISFAPRPTDRSLRFLTCKLPTAASDNRPTIGRRGITWGGEFPRLFQGIPRAWPHRLFPDSPLQTWRSSSSSPQTHPPAPSADRKASRSALRTHSFSFAFHAAFDFSLTYCPGFQ